MSDFKQFEQQDFTTDYLGEGVRYRLPPRQLGRLRQLGWIVVLFGTVLTLFSTTWTAGSVRVLQDELAKGGAGLWIAIVFSCVGLFIFVQGLVMTLAGIAVIRNRTHCEIEVRGGKIRVKERLSLFRLRRKRPAADIQRLRVVTASESMQGKQDHSTLAWLGEFDAALLAETSVTRKFPIAAAYPRELLVRLAEELAPRLEADVQLASASFERDPVAVAVGEPVPQTIEVVEGTAEPREFAAVPVQPVGSNATIDRRPYGITIEIPPVGIWKGSKGLFFVAIIWNAFISIFVVFATLGAIGVIEVEGDGGPGGLLLFLMLFVAVGVGLMAGAINMGRRRATIATADDLVMIVRHSIFGKSTREWSADQIDNIGCGNSGMEVNDVPIRELQIIPSDGRKFGCLSQLDDDELNWIAAELNQALAVQRQA